MQPVKSDTGLLYKQLGLCTQLTSLQMLHLNSECTDQTIVLATSEPHNRKTCLHSGPVSEDTQQSLYIHNLGGPSMFAIWVPEGGQAHGLDQTAQTCRLI